MFLSDPLDCNSNDIIDFVWSFRKLDTDRALNFVAAPITAKHQNTNFNSSIRHGYFDYIEIAMTGDDANRPGKSYKMYNQNAPNVSL